MKKACLVVAHAYQGNRIFDKNNEILNRDNCLAPFRSLKNEFQNYGFDLSTDDINSISGSDLVIYNEMPDKFPRDHDPSKSYLIIFETELIKKRNWDLKRHSFFRKIFTWNDKFVDNKKYFKINFSYEFPSLSLPDLKEKNKFCALIAGNKMVKHPLELYSRRVEAIRWFEENHPDKFDLFGIGWDKYCFSGIARHLNRFQLLRKHYPFRPYPSYKGMIISKHDILKRYKFSICYENAFNIDGYITEKIFDCFFSSCVPIYWGANNISDHIPASCFIDKRDFTSYSDLFTYLNNMDNQMYLKYLESIQRFLNGQYQNYPIDQFKSSTFAKTIVKELVSE